jgi:hypothetical protein
MILVDDSDKRTIIVGDIHGMFDSLEDLLHNTLSFDKEKDTLICAGDMVAKGPLGGSLAVLNFLSTNNITAVRGNHDQKVVEWRSWIEWISTLPGGRQWLDAINKRYKNFEDSLSVNNRADEDIIDNWISLQEQEDRDWWKLIPQDFKILKDHYWIATKMTPRDFDYLLQLPLRLHAPHAHTFIVHAGILASNPSKAQGAEGQPLATMPIYPAQRNGVQHMSKEKIKVLRRIQEASILTDVPQNTDPWVTLNMRSIKENGNVSK